MNAEAIRNMMIWVSDEVIGQEDALCRLDSFIGDGDHGVTAARGFTAVKKCMEETCFELPAQVMERTGDILADTMGGAIGPIIGALFSGGSTNLKDRTEWETAEFCTMYGDGLTRIKLVGGAKEGDRTLVDALSPAADTLAECAQAGEDIKTSLKKAAAAAKTGAESTKDMIAKKGRAKFLGEKSRGYVDAGATTMYLVVKAMSEYVSQEDV